MTPAETRDKYLQRTYGITSAMYDQMLQEQGGGCAGCGKIPKPGQRRLHVDHDHRTGKVRMIVCWKCNSAISKMRDSSRTAYNLARYLEKAGN